MQPAPPARRSAATKFVALYNLGLLAAGSRAQDCFAAVLASMPDAAQRVRRVPAARFNCVESHRNYVGTCSPWAVHFMGDRTGQKSSLIHRQICRSIYARRAQAGLVCRDLCRLCERVNVCVCVCVCLCKCLCSMACARVCARVGVCVWATGCVSVSVCVADTSDLAWPSSRGVPSANLRMQTGDTRMLLLTCSIRLLREQTACQAALAAVIEQQASIVCLARGLSEILPRRPATAPQQC